MAVSDGPLFNTSRSDAVFIGPSSDLKAGEDLPPVVSATRAPIYRPMKTTVIFQPEAMEDAILAMQEQGPITEDELPKVRRLNRSNHYLQSLAYAHIPFLNDLIASYRMTSQDPFAFQVSQWDVPIWFAEYNGQFVPICLMPYSDSCWYPVLRKFEQKETLPFHAATPEDVQEQAKEDVAPGTLEILDARSLLYRGHLDDAVRSAVTAIEVALEAQITKLLVYKGWNEQRIESRLAETWNDFDRRLNDYERISETRVPGPVLSCVPYINGIRLKAELNRVRKLRHKIVHEGLRVDSHSKGPMLRAIETMTWLFSWLSWEEGKLQDRARNYVFFEMSRGMHIPRYRIGYRDSGVAVLLYGDENKQEEEYEDPFKLQYFATIDGEKPDIELFTLMSLAYLGIEADDAPPPLPDPTANERYLISHAERNSIVFCLNCDRLIDAAAIEAVVLRFRECKKDYEGDCSSLCIINHQKDLAMELRETDKAIPADVAEIADRNGITLITAPDLRLLVQGTNEYQWDIEPIKKLLFAPGRQGEVPPGYRMIGTCVHFYGQISVMSVELHSGETIETGNILGIRLGTRWHEEPIESLQVDHKTVPVATGPCRAGIKTTLQRSDIDVGQPVFVRLA